MANTYQLISSVTVGSGGAANIEFTSIPQTYTDLILKLSLQVQQSGVDMIKLTFNNNSSGYSYRSLFANGSGAYSYSGSSLSYLEHQYSNGTATTNIFSNSELYIPNYTSSNNKSISVDTVNEANATDGYIIPMAQLWANSSAITSIKLVPNSSINFSQYSTAYLYGISNA